jgi:hypothetical protein
MVAGEALYRCNRKMVGAALSAFLDNTMMK